MITEINLGFMQKRCYLEKKKFRVRKTYIQNLGERSNFVKE